MVRDETGTLLQGDGGMKDGFWRVLGRRRESLSRCGDGRDWPSAGSRNRREDALGVLEGDLVCVLYNAGGDAIVLPHIVASVSRFGARR